MLRAAIVPFGVADSSIEYAIEYAIGGALLLPSRHR
jgi:hypothetical protein